MSGISWVLSWRFPPVSVRQAGIPVASTKRWCFEPFLARSTGSRPVSRPPFSPARDCRRRPPATTRLHPPLASAQAAPHAAAPKHRPSATRPSAANRSHRSRNQAPAADAPTRSPCAAQTRSPATPNGPEGASDPDSESAAPFTGKSGSISSHNSSETIHGAVAIGTPLSLTTNADGIRHQPAGPFITKGALRRPCGAVPDQAWVARRPQPRPLGLGEGDGTATRRVWGGIRCRG